MKAYNGVRIPVYAEVHLPVVYKQQELVFPLIVVPVVHGDSPPLLGRNWLEQMKLNWRNIFHMSKVDTLSDVLGRHKMGFDKGLGTIIGFTADIKLHAQDGAKPIFCKARPVPGALCQKVEEELDRLEKLGVVKNQWNGVTGLLLLFAYPRKMEVYVGGPDSN